MANVKREEHFCENWWKRTDTFVVVSDQFSNVFVLFKSLTFANSDSKLEIYFLSLQKAYRSKITNFLPDFAVNSKSQHKIYLRSDANHLRI